MSDEKNVRRGKPILLIDPSVILKNPSQPRKIFDKEELYSLADSICANGILQPIPVRQRDDGRYELVAGERRLRAARIAGIKSVPCVEVRVSERTSAMLALLENVGRQNLNFFEEAEAIKRLIEKFEFTEREVARKLGKSPKTISNKLRLLKLSEEQREEILEKGLSESHARALLRLPDEAERVSAMEYIVQRQLNVSQSELYIKNILNPFDDKRTTVRGCDVRLFFNTINKAIYTMRQSGIPAVADREDSDDYTVYTIKIPVKNDKSIA